MDHEHDEDLSSDRPGDERRIDDPNSENRDDHPVGTTSGTGAGATAGAVVGGAVGGPAGAVVGAWGLAIDPDRVGPASVRSFRSNSGK